MSVSGIGSSVNSYAISQMMSQMQTRGPSGGEASAQAKEKPDLAELLSQLDTDSSGSLDTEAELQSFAEKISGFTGVSDGLTEFMNTYDSDTDGTLSEEEALSALEANRPQGPPPPPGGMGRPDETEMVNAADENGDGVISADEAQTLVDIINNANGTELTVEEFLSEYGADSETGLTLEEAVAAMEANRPDEFATASAAIGSSFEEAFVSALGSSGDDTLSTEDINSLISFINEATGSTYEYDDFVAEYGSDSTLSADQAIAAMEANRPDSPPSEGGNMTAAAMETYQLMSAMGTGNTGDLLSMMMEDPQQAVNRMI